MKSIYSRSASQQNVLEGLQEQFGGYWGEHPDYPARDWRHEVADDDTRLGYWDWVESKTSES